MPTLTNSTKPLSVKSVSTKWHLIDAKNKILGRVAVEIAKKLIGKEKVYQADYLDCGDEVVVTNAASVVLTGQKLLNKKYTSYSGYPGGLKIVSASKMLADKPNKMLLTAVKGMLPKNKLRSKRLKRLHIFSSENHTFLNKFS